VVGNLYRMGHFLLMLFAAIGAGTILFALAFISLVIGGLTNAMITLMSGPIIDRYFGRLLTRGRP
jgi:hypothetical protein